MQAQALCASVSSLCALARSPHSFVCGCACGVADGAECPLASEVTDHSKLLSDRHSEVLWRERSYAAVNVGKSVHLQHVGCASPATTGKNALSTIRGERPTS